MGPVRTSSAVARIAADQRAANARLTTAAIGLLTALAAVVVPPMGAKPGVGAVLAATAAGQGFAYWLLRKGKITAGVLVCGALLLAEHIGVEVIEGDLGPIPYIASIVILLVAAAAPSRWLPVSFAGCLAVLGIEAWQSPWGRPEQEAIVAAALWAAVVFVVSLLHVRGTERAFALAEKQDRARESAAAEAVESERRYRLIADSADDLISLVDAAGKALYLSPSHERVLGLAVEAALGKPLLERVNIENVQAADDAFARALEQGESRVDLQVRRADGKLRLLDASMKRVAAEQSPLVAIIGRDATERRDLEARLHASERLEALGRLAGGVAHDFNNMLTVITGLGEFARRSLPADSKARLALDSVLEAAGTAAELAGQLLTFSRRQLLVRTRVDVGAVLERQREILDRLVGTRVRIEYDFEDDLPLVLMPAAHVEQVAMNLASNARDAMPSGGLLRLRLRKRELGDREVRDLVAGRYLELEMGDEGTGIPQDVLPHIFEPLFSTKGSAGSGLGLATCFGIAVQAGGAIDVTSRVGKGTTFRVLLPAAEGPEAPRTKSAQPRDVRHVLVVDDDAGVREMTTRMLRADGLEVLAASTLAEARSFLDDGRIDIDAVVTDVVLGAERGTDLIATCHRSRPQARIVVTSGYTPEPDASAVVDATGVGFLPKPFGRDQLLAALRGG
jgi:two-component system, cell cycle sensor histidine kinase and response regulator CckA